MVAAQAANQALDVSTASELGWLLHAHVRIQDPRWRLQAIVRLVPLLRRFGLSLERFHTEARELAQRAVAPRPIRGRLAEALLAAFDNAPADALARFVDALFVHDWTGSQSRAIAGALAIGDRVLALEFVSARPRPTLEALVARGVIGDELVASVELADVLEPSIPLVKAMTDLRAAERVACGLRPQERAIAQALLARLERTPESAHTRLRSIREVSVRSVGGLAVVRHALAHGMVERARWHAARIERALPADRARLEIARYLAEHGDARSALRELATILEPRLWAENVLLRSEIRLAQARDRERVLRWWHLSRTSWQGPAWAALGPSLDVETRHIAMSGVALLRIEQRESQSGHAFEMLGRARGIAPLVVELCNRFGVDLEAALTFPLRPVDTRIAAELRVALIAYRATRLASLPTAMQSGVTGAAPTTNDAHALERATYDEGVALSERSANRRRVLIGVAQHCVRSALAAPETWKPAVVAARLRTLVHLGGALGTGAIRAALATLPVGRFSQQTFEALCVADARAALELLLEQPTRWTSLDVDALFQLVEVHHGVERGFAHAYRVARATIGREQLRCARTLHAKQGADAWLERFFALWRQRFGGRPDALVLQSLVEREHIPTPEEVFGELAGVADRLRRANHYDTFEALRTSDTLLTAAMVATPARANATTRRWSFDHLREHLKILPDDKVKLCRETVRSVARILRCPEVVLARGDLGALGVPVVTELEAEQAAYRLRLLDKCVDILTYLRFADVPARSCFRSDAESWFWSADAVANVWRDPLSMTFHIESCTSDGWKPCGFLFGSFVELRAGLGVAFNSLHIRPNRSPVRHAVIEAAERALRPLGLVAIAIANCHGGSGSLPNSYERRSVQVRRVRALRQHGRLVADGDDDLCISNQTVVATHLWWHDLE